MKTRDKDEWKKSKVGNVSEKIYLSNVPCKKNENHNKEGTTQRYYVQNRCVKCQLEYKFNYKKGAVNEKK